MRFSKYVYKNGSWTKRWKSICWYLTQNQTLDNSLLNLNTNTSTSSATNKCSPPEWVPIWEWIPAVTCRIKYMLPPKISVSDWSCWSSLASFMWYGYLDEIKIE